MKALVIYDSAFGNTEKIAQAISQTLGGELKFVKETDHTKLKGIDLLVVGSPTQGGQATKPLQEFLNKIPDGALKNTKVVSFDTRISAKQQAGWWLSALAQLVTGIFGFAAPRIAKSLESKGGILIAEPEGFIVEGTKGPLAPSELDRAKTWAKKLL
ncbi:MAG TPA: flavodoxin family protein [Candidatus Nanoarchaeia archaeon]|nr:hypothetical protein [uncultured archaeon]